MRSFEDKRMGRPAPKEPIFDEKEMADKFDLQLRQYRARNPDPELVKLGQKLIDETDGEDFDATEISLKHGIAICYLHGPAVQKGYRGLKADPHDTAFFKQRLYSIPKLDLTLAKTELERFGLLRED